MINGRDDALDEVCDGDSKEGADDGTEEGAMITTESAKEGNDEESEEGSDDGTQESLDMNGEDGAMLTAETPNEDDEEHKEDSHLDDRDGPISESPNNSTMHDLSSLSDNYKRSEKELEGAAGIHCHLQLNHNLAKHQLGLGKIHNDMLALQRRREDIGMECLTDELSRYESDYKAAKQQWSIEWPMLLKQQLKSTTSCAEAENLSHLNSPASENSNFTDSVDLQDCCQKLMPLAIAGYSVRRRRLEHLNENVNRDQEIVSLGHKAAHWGMALADASMFEGQLPAPLTGPMSQKDLDNFVNFYHVTPATVFKLQNSEKMMNIYDWHGSVKNFTEFRKDGDGFSDTPFSRHFSRMLKHVSELPVDQQDWTLLIEDDEFMATSYILLQKDFEERKQVMCNRGIKRKFPF